MSRYLVYPVLTEENKIIVYFHYFKINKIYFQYIQIKTKCKEFFFKFSFALLKELQFVLTFSQPEGHKTSLYYFQFYD